jgi:hypothetical protein
LDVHAEQQVEGNIALRTISTVSKLMAELDVAESLAHCLCDKLATVGLLPADEVVQAQSAFEAVSDAASKLWSTRCHERLLICGACRRLQPRPRQRRLPRALQHWQWHIKQSARALRKLSSVMTKLGCIFKAHRVCMPWHQFVRSG